MLGTGLGLLVWVSGPFINQAEQLTNQLSSGYQQIISEWPNSGSAFQQSIASQLPPLETLYQWIASPKSNQALLSMVGFISVSFEWLAKIALIFVLSLYWSADRAHFERLLLSLIAPEGRPHLRLAWQSIENNVGAYIRRELAQILLAGLFLWLGYQLLGLENPLVLASLGAAVWLIPWFGIVIALIAPLLGGFALNLWMGLLAALYTLLVLACLEWVIEPRIFPKQTYSSVILMLVALAMADAFGLIGLILAPLVSASIQIVWRDLVSPTLVKREGPNGVSSNEELNARLMQVKEAFDHPQETPKPEITSLLARLEALIAEAHIFLG